jgi:hypothetical protein
MKYLASITAILFAAILIWRVALPMNHNRRIGNMETDIRNTPIYTTEEYIQDAIARNAVLEDRIAAEKRKLSAGRDRLNLALAVSGVAFLAVATPLILRRKGK